MMPMRSQGENRHDSDWGKPMPLQNYATDGSLYAGRRVEMP